jgi:hypothetical protein
MRGQMAWCPPESGPWRPRTPHFVKPRRWRSDVGSPRARMNGELRLRRRRPSSPDPMLDGVVGPTDHQEQGEYDQHDRQIHCQGCEHLPRLPRSLTSSIISWPGPPGRPDLRRSTADRGPGSCGTRAGGPAGHGDASRWLVEVYRAERPPWFGIGQGLRERAADPVRDPGNQVPRQAHGHRCQRDHERPEHEIDHRSPPSLRPRAGGRLARLAWARRGLRPCLL